jgi:hypothetical protein
MRSSTIYLVRPARIHPKLLVAALSVMGCLGAAGTQAATTTLTFNAPAVLQEMDHPQAHAWPLSYISIQPNQTITGVSSTFTNIRNWDNNTNVLHLDLLNTAKFSGLAPFVGDPSDSTPLTDFSNDFVNHPTPAWLGANNPRSSLPTNDSFTMTATTYTANFTEAQLTTTDRIGFSMDLTIIPKVANLSPLLGLIAVAATSELLRRRRKLAPVVA